jgi:hypothetical protein
MRWGQVAWGRAPWRQAALAILLLGALGNPARAEQRWLGCKYNDVNGKTQNFYMVFDDRRGIASILDAGSLVAGTNTTTNFQSLRARFPEFTITYNRNDGALAVNPTTGGILSGECRRVAQPPGAPNLQ